MDPAAGSEEWGVRTERAYDVVRVPKLIRAVTARQQGISGPHMVTLTRIALRTFEVPRTGSAGFQTGLCGAVSTWGSAEQSRARRARAADCKELVSAPLSPAIMISASTAPNAYRGYQFPAEVIAHAVWLYLRFPLSLRDVEELLAERGIQVSYETVRC